MTVYRVYVRSQDRVSGFPGSFSYQLNDVFRRQPNGLCKVLLESISQVRFSPVSSDYVTRRPENAGSLLVNLGGGIPSQTQSVDTWSGDRSRSITQLQSWNNSGIFGRSSGPNHVSKHAIGSTFDSAVLSRVRVIEPYLEFFSHADGSVRKVASTDSVEDWSMVLIFFTAEALLPRELSDVFTPHARIVLSSASRSSGTVADCIVLFNLDSPVAPPGSRFHLLVEHASTVYHDTATSNLNSGLTLRCDFVSNSETATDNSVHFFSRSYWSVEDGFYGISLVTNSQITSQDFGHPVVADIRKTSRWRLSLVDSITGQPPNDSGQLSEYLVSFVLFQSN